MSSLFDVATILRDRQDPSEIRRIATRLVGLRALSLTGRAPPWEELVAGGPEAVEQARQTLERAYPGLWPRPLPDLPSPVWDGLLDALTHLDARAPDALGELFTGLIGHLARAEAKRGGQYFTPPSLVDLLLALVPVEGLAVYDPCCGSGGLLIRAAQQGASRIVGQEVNPETWRLARWNALIHQQDGDLGEAPADTLRRDLHRGTRFHAALANPPFNLANWSDASTDDDPRFALGPPRKRANVAWVLHLLAHLTDGGRAAVVLPVGSLHGRDPDARRIRRAVGGRIEAVLALPDRLFHNTAIESCVWLLGPESPAVHLFDLRGHGELVDRSTRILPAHTLARVAADLAQARGGALLDEAGWSKTMAADALEGDLRPGRHIRPAMQREGTTEADLRAAVETVRRLVHEAREADDALLDALDRLAR